MLVVFRKPHASYSYFPGDEVDLADETAHELIDGGFAKAIDKTAETETATAAKGTETGSAKPAGNGKPSKPE